MANKYIRCFFVIATVTQQAFSECLFANNAPENGNFKNISMAKAAESDAFELECNDGYRLHPKDAVRECEKDSNGNLIWQALTASCIDIDECKDGISNKIDEPTFGDSISLSSSDSSNNNKEEPEIIDLVEPCHDDAECTNTPGSYECRCKECYIGNGEQCEPDNTPCKELNETLENGMITELTYKNSIYYTCKEDYQVAFSYRNCDCGNWVPSPDISPICTFKGCPKPRNIEHGIVVYYSHTYGSISRYFCDKKFSLKGPNERTCKASGEWSNFEPVCKPVETFEDVAIRFKESFVNKVGSYSNTSSASEALLGRLAANAVGLDIIFAFDASSSISETDFQYGVEFSKLLVDEFSVSYDEGGTRIAAIIFNSAATIVFNFNHTDADTVDKVKGKLESIREHHGGGTAIRQAFELIHSTVVKNMRETAKRALFIMTDGASNDGNPVAAARGLRMKDIEIFAIGIGTQVDRHQLNSIASTPYSSHVYLIDSFQDLKILSEVISEKRVDFNSCGVAIDIDIIEAQKEAGRGMNYVEVPNSWPWVASVSREFNNTFKHICGGTLICNQWVLTAASCVSNKYSESVQTKRIRVKFGQHNKSSDAEIEVQERNVEEIVLADNFAKNTFGRDLALLKLETPVVLASYVRTACLGNADNIGYSKFSEDCYTIGWGARNPLDKSEEHLDVLTQLRMPIKNDNECRQEHSVEFKEHGENLLCAGSSGPDESACVGDVGGALVCMRRDGKWAVVGVTVPNSQCDKNWKYGVYTRPDRFSKWINETTSNCLDDHLNIFS